jgi:hypothetical protein
MQENKKTEIDQEFSSTRPTATNLKTKGKAIFMFLAWQGKLRSPVSFQVRDW